MKKKLLSIICASALVTTVFAGCSSANAGSDKTSKDEVTLKVLTNRTDITDSVLKEIGDSYYEKTGVKVEWEGISDYVGVVQTRLNTQDYGDVLNILPALTTEELPQFFEPFGEVEEFSDYIGIASKVNDGLVYGIPNGIGVSGVVYNKKVFEAAGYNEFPTTLNGLYESLAKINEQEGVVPVAINTVDKWALGSFDSLAGIMYGNPYYMRDMGKMDNVFSAGVPTGDALEVLYKLVSEGWVEEDLATTNWEQSKVDLAKGKTGMMILAMWAVSQVQELADNPEDIAIAPFPTNNDGKLQAEAGPDNHLGVSKNSKHKEEAKDFAIYYANSLEYLDSQGFIPANKKLESTNPVVKAYQNSGVELLLADPAEADPKASDLTTEIAAEAGVKFWEGSYIQEAAIAAKKGRAEFEAYVNKLNEKWNKAKADLAE